MACSGLHRGSCWTLLYCTVGSDVRVRNVYCSEMMVLACESDWNFVGLSAEWRRLTRLAIFCSSRSLINRSGDLQLVPRDMQLPSRQLLIHFEPLYFIFGMDVNLELRSSNLACDLLYFILDL